VLTKDGQIKYYKDDVLHRGTIVLDKNSVVNRASKDQIDIVLASGRTFNLFADALVLDVWSRDLLSVIDKL